MFRERLKKIPDWAFPAAFFLASAAAGCFAAVAALEMMAQGMHIRIGVAMQAFMVLFSSAVTTGIFALLNRGFYFALQSFTHGGLACPRREFLRDARMFQTLRFLVCVPTAILSFFYPIGLMVYSLWELAAGVLCYICLYLWMQRHYLRPEARRSALLTLMIPVLVYFLVMGVLL